MKKLIVMLLALASFALHAQNTSKVRFFVKGGEKYFVRIDGELQPQTNIFNLEKGSHEVEIWSFKHDVFKGVLETGNLDSTNYFAELRKSEDFIGYLRQKDDYKRKLFFARTAPYLITGVSGLTLPFIIVSRNTKHEEYVQSQFYFDRGQIPSTTFKTVQNQYRTQNALFYTAAAGTVLGVASFFLLKPYAKKLTPPVFRQVNPFTMERMELSYNQISRSPELGLTLNF